MANTLNVSVVAADHPVWSGEASMVVAKTTIGEIGVLPGHEPILALLASGQVRLTLPDGSKRIVNAEGGYFSMAANIVTVVASQAELVEA